MPRITVSCPLCGATESYVTHTLPSFEFIEGVRQIVTTRRRVCNACGLPFKSRETTVPEETSPPRLPRDLKT